MLERLVQPLARFAIAFIVLLLTFVFVFTSPFNSNTEGCGTGSEVRYAARVYGTSVTTGDFEASLALSAFALSGGRALRLPNQLAEQYDLRKHLMDGLVERTLLARHAESLGFAVNQEVVWTQLREQGTALVSLGTQADLLLPRAVPLPVKNEDGEFDKENTTNFIENGLRRGLGDFAESQRQEQLAERVRQLVAATVRIGEREAWDAYVQEKDRAVISYVRLRPSFFTDRLEPSEDELAAFLEEHRETLESRYQTRKAEFEDIPREILARHIFVRLEEGAGEAQQEAAFQRARGILEKVQAGREPFSALARRYSDDSGSARRGGRLPQRNRPQAVEDMLLTLAPGSLSDLVQSSRGIHILLAEGVREGTLSEDEALSELALSEYREVEGRRLAHDLAEQIRVAAATEASFESALEQLGYGRDDTDDQDPFVSDRPPPADRPTAERSRWVNRGSVPITGITSAALLTSIFDELTLESPVPDRVLEANGEFIAYRLEERETPEEADFTDEVKERLSGGLLEAKREEALSAFVFRLRKQAEEDGAITINEALLNYKAEDDDF